jgi:hypothetical protein
MDTEKIIKTDSDIEVNRLYQTPVDLNEAGLCDSMQALALQKLPMKGIIIY